MHKLLGYILSCAKPVIFPVFLPSLSLRSPIVVLQKIAFFSTPPYVTLAPTSLSHILINQPSPNIQRNNSQD